MAEGIAANEEQQRVLAGILPPGTVADRVIRKLECSKHRFLESRANRRPSTELKAERAKWQSRRKAWKKVQEVEEPEWWERTTAALIRARVEEAKMPTVRSVPWLAWAHPVRPGTLRPGWLVHTGSGVGNLLTLMLPARFLARHRS
jgi:hypothetical protein